jgi:uncharacterized membrane protein (UPF0127 family)
MRCRFLFVVRHPAALMRWAMRVLLLALAATLMAECSRTPAEEFPSRATTAPTVVLPSASAASQPTLPATPTATAPSMAHRCVLPTPSSAPAPVQAGPAPGCPRDPEGPQKVPVVQVGFPDVAGVSVEAELVSSEHDTQRGLMYRKSMPEEHGMLFNLGEREDHKFWMHNTCIPLDLLYIDDDGLIVGIVENAPTLDDSPRGVGCLSRYVLETNAGWSRRHGVRAGQRAALPRELASPR